MMLPEGAVECAATMLQPEQDRAEHDRIRSRSEAPKSAQTSGFTNRAGRSRRTPT